MKANIYNFKTTNNIDEIKDEAYEKGFRPAMEFKVKQFKADYSLAKAMRNFMNTHDKVIELKKTSAQLVRFQALKAKFKIWLAKLKDKKALKAFNVEIKKERENLLGNKKNILGILNENVGMYGKATKAFSQKKATIDNLISRNADVISEYQEAEGIQERSPNSFTEYGLKQAEREKKQIKKELVPTLKLAILSAKSIAVTANGVLFSLNNLSILNKLNRNPYLSKAIEACQYAYSRVHKSAMAVQDPRQKEKIKAIANLAESIENAKVAMYFLKQIGIAHKSVNTATVAMRMLKKSCPDSPVLKELGVAFKKFRTDRDALSAAIKKGRASTKLKHDYENSLQNFSESAQKARDIASKYPDLSKIVQTSSVSSQPGIDFEKYAENFAGKIVLSEEIIDKIPQSLKLHNHLQMAHDICLDAQTDLFREINGFQYKNHETDKDKKVNQSLLLKCTNRYNASYTVLDNTLNVYSKLDKDGRVTEILGSTDSELRKLEEVKQKLLVQESKSTDFSRKNKNIKQVENLIDKLSQTRNEFIDACNNVTDNLISGSSSEKMQLSRAKLNLTFKNLERRVKAVSKFRIK